jgi:hypothetical protein
VTSSLRVTLDGTPDQLARLKALQVAFAQVCNAIAPIVQATRCWNRVALHHLVYHPMRQQFPALGSQMICNAVYAVSRSARMVFQHPKSPWNVAKRGAAPLPLLHFADSAPVYFDRHTLSVKDGRLSMFTLDGRIRFQVPVTGADEARFHDEKLLHVVMDGNGAGFDLIFAFVGPNAALPSREMATEVPLPPHVVVRAPMETPGLAAVLQVPLAATPSPTDLR